jgi:hypothetical protein
VIKARYTAQMSRLLAIFLCLPLLAQACVPERDDYGRIKRSRKVLSIFRATVPCPATGEVGKRCKGYVIDHKIALACCGSDTIENMQYQTIADAKLKDKWERKLCGAAD